VLHQIAPGLFKLLPPRLAETLAMPLLWAATTTTTLPGFPLMPQPLAQRICTVVRQVLNIAADTPIPKLVTRVPLVVSGDAGVLHIIEIEGEAGADTPRHGGGAADTPRALLEQMVALQSNHWCQTSPGGSAHRNASRTAKLHGSI
jgi:hypothetical protein